MTAEIAILNREAIALASDSAVTIGQGTKIYNSANKIFTLSKFHPVGIMVFGNASFMNIPWETVIKDFRKKLHDKCFNSLEEYAKEFISYLGKNTSDIGAEIQKDYVIMQVTASIFIEIRNRLINEVDLYLKENDHIESSEVEKKLVNIIEDYHKQFNAAAPLENLPKEYLDTLKKEFGESIIETMKNIFEKLNISETEQLKLQEIIYFILTKQLFPDSASGVVICGFGENELFPSLISYNIESSIFGNVKYKRLEYLKADSKGTATITAFAQGEMTHTFIRGIDPEYKTAIEKFIKENLEIFSEQVVDNLGILKSKYVEKGSLKEKLKNDVIPKITANFKSQMDTYSQENHINPIINSVGVLPKDELASMAETFINLTSFKRRVASDQKETVGGPVDVAVISKGDGFIWIKRKHYFKPELNQHFLRNYYNKKIDVGDCNEK